MLFDFVLTCAVLHNMKPHQGRPDKALTPAVATLQNEEVLYVPDENYRNPSREAKHQQDLLKDSFNHLCAFLGRGT